jgi:hypothetical protein
MTSSVVILVLLLFNAFALSSRAPIRICFGARFSGIPPLADGGSFYACAVRASSAVVT